MKKINTLKHGSQIKMFCVSLKCFHSLFVSFHEQNRNRKRLDFLLFLNCFIFSVCVIFVGTIYV